MTTAQLSHLIGRAGILRTAEGLGVAITIVDARETFGRTDVKVTPIAGDSSAWVSRSRVSLVTLDESPSGTN